MQQQLAAERPELEIQILGVNERGHEIGNPAITTGRTIPWLQDVDANQDGASDNFMNAWDYAYRDVVIVDSQNVPIEAYNLTTHDLAVPENFNELMQKLIDAATSIEAPSWTNPVDPLDVNNDTFVSPLDSLLVINELNGLGARELEPPSGSNVPPPFIDVSGDGFVSPIDALHVINRLNEINSVQSVAAVAAIGSTTWVESRSDGGARTESDISNHLLATAVDAIFFDHDEISSHKRRIQAASPQLAPRL